MAESFKNLSGRESFRMSVASVATDVDEDGNPIHGKDKSFVDMGQAEQDAVTTLGWAQENWDDPDLLDDERFPLNRTWGELSAEEQSAAVTLGFSHFEFTGRVDDQAI